MAGTAGWLPKDDGPKDDGEEPRPVRLFGTRAAGTTRGSVRQSGSDALQLVIDYLKQETLGPLKGLGRFLLFGIAGSVALCGGLTVLLIALLRGLQETTGSTFAGNWDWAPYLIVSFGALLFIGLAAWRITKGPASRRLPAGKKEGGD
ncbi:MAG: hypothetical protein ACRDYZ_12385 [Acidimicrobiales bacterium]